MDYRGIISAKPRQPGRGVPRRGAGSAALGPCPRQELPTRERASVLAEGTPGLGPAHGSGAHSLAREVQPPSLRFWTQKRGLLPFSRPLRGMRRGELSSRGITLGSVSAALSKTRRPQELPAGAIRERSPRGTSPSSRSAQLPPVPGSPEPCGLQRFSWAPVRPHAWGPRSHGPTEPANSPGTPGPWGPGSVT